MADDDKDLNKRRLLRAEKLREKRKEIEEDNDLSYKEAKGQLDEIDDMISLLTGESGTSKAPINDKVKKKGSWI
jgi:hypothetical protein